MRRWGQWGLVGLAIVVLVAGCLCAEAPATIVPHRSGTETLRLLELSESTATRTKEILPIVKLLSEGMYGSVYHAKYKGQDIALKAPKDVAGAVREEKFKFGGQEVTGYVKDLAGVLLECDYFKMMELGDEAEVGHDNVLRGVGPVCAVVPAGKEKDLEGELEITEGVISTRDTILETNTDNSSKEASAVVVAKKLYEDKLVPVILLELASGSLLDGGYIMEELQRNEDDGKAREEYYKFLAKISTEGNMFHGLYHQYVSIARGLSYLASGNSAKGRPQFLHRDLKPANVMFIGEKNPTIRIGDLGGGYAISEPLPKDFASMVNAAVGTPGYMPPEGCYYNRIYREPMDLDSMGFGYNGLYDKPNGAGEPVRTSLIADPKHKELVAGRDLFSLGQVLHRQLHAICGGSDSTYINPSGRIVLSLVEGQVAFRGCSHEEEYLYEHDPPYWEAISTYFGRDSNIVKMLKKLQTCNLHKRPTSSEAIRLIEESELNLSVCRTEKHRSDPSRACRQVLYPTTDLILEKLSPRYFDSEQKFNSYYVIPVIRDKDAVEFVNSVFSAALSTMRGVSDGDQSKIEEEFPAFNKLRSQYCGYCTCEGKMENGVYSTVFSDSCTKAQYKCCSCVPDKLLASTATLWDNNMLTTFSECAELLEIEKIQDEMSEFESGVSEWNSMVQYGSVVTYNQLDSVVVRSVAGDSLVINDSPVSSTDTAGSSTMEPVQSLWLKALSPSGASKSDPDDR